MLYVALISFGLSVCLSVCLSLFFFFFYFLFYLFFLYSFFVCFLRFLFCLAGGFKTCLPGSIMAKSQHGGGSGSATHIARARTCVHTHNTIIQYNFIAKRQYTDCTRNVLWCQVHSSHIHSNHKTFNYNNSK